MEELGHDGKLAATKGGTAADDREMHRMGKAQELRVGVPYDEHLLHSLTVSSVTSSLYVTTLARRRGMDNRLTLIAGRHSRIRDHLTSNMYAVSMTDHQLQILLTCCSAQGRVRCLPITLA